MLRRVQGGVLSLGDKAATNHNNSIISHGYTPSSSGRVAITACSAAKSTLPSWQAYRLMICHAGWLHRPWTRHQMHVSRNAWGQRHSPSLVPRSIFPLRSLQSSLATLLAVFPHCVQSSLPSLHSVQPSLRSMGSAPTTVGPLAHEP